MADDVCAEPRLRAALGLYLTGALPDAELSAVESHLGTCAVCLADADRLGEAAVMLALLSETDRRELVAEFGTRAGEPAEEHDHHHPPVRVVPAPDAPPAPVRPAADRPRARPGGGTGPGRWRSRRSRLLLAGVGLAVVALLSAGVALGTSMIGGLRQPEPVTLVTNAQGGDVTLSVTVLDADGTVTLEALVTGLTRGELHRFYARDVDGGSHLLTEMTGTGGPIQINAPCPVPIDRLAEFSVTAADGSLVVQAIVDRGASGSGTPD
ncbi:MULTISPECIES: zf-HC2 domain-containing protein [Catenuloplanes]|uniref:Anti-sigma-YlaC factor YlaD n=1 Tax=Catenuloplanes niger TaxID=587534 RepID=A0AAE3ZW02_9ACTN|nr:zf-HC2 domain-containing protein [Catenuloplanes niger]MDR7325952.1 putative anti-sigma-YlaC factor YlaD [Catenuloplanes niger]